MRSTIKNESFYSRRIMETESIVNESYDRLKNGQVPVERIINVKRLIYSQHFHIIIRKYSAGISIEQLRPDFLSSLYLIDSIWPDDGKEIAPDFLFDWYLRMVWSITFGMGLGISENEFTPIISTWDKTGRKDWLIEYLLSSRLSNRPKVESLIFPKPYATLKSAVEAQEANNPELASSLVKRYLEKEWYKGHKEAYWYDNHKSKHDTFFGYWSFEAAAIVKIAGIDDSSFRDNEYYPKDLLG